MISPSLQQNKPLIKVVAAVIVNDKKIYSAQRDYGDFKGLWEFPGGKIEKGETPQIALHREISEELDAQIGIDSFLMNVRYEYPKFILDMDAFLCHAEVMPKIKKGIHSASAWKSLSSLSSEEWCPADKIIVQELIKRYQH